MAGVPTATAAAAAAGAAGAAAAGAAVIGMMWDDVVLATMPAATTVSGVAVRLERLCVTNASSSSPTPAGVDGVNGVKGLTFSSIVEKLVLYDDVRIHCPLPLPTSSDTDAGADAPLLRRHAAAMNFVPKAMMHNERVKGAGRVEELDCTVVQYHPHARAALSP